MASVHNENDSDEVDNAPTVKIEAWDTSKAFIPKPEHKRFAIVAVLLASVLTIIALGTDATGSFFITPDDDGACDEPFTHEWDETFSCPIPVKVMSQLCVTDVTFCPAALTCPDGLKICWDASCSVTCPEIDDDYYGNACGGACGVPCMAVFMTAQEFKDSIANVPDTAFSVCVDNTDFVWTEPVYIFFFIWMTTVPTLAFLWSFVNQRILSKNFEPKKVAIKKMDNMDQDTGLFAIQIGYTPCPLGNFIYFIVVLTGIFIQVCFVVLSVSYYNNDKGLGGWTMEPDYRQAFLSFEIAWTVGAVWMVCVKWPTSLRMYFWSRTSLAAAAQVCIWVPDEQILISNDASVANLSAWADTFTSFYNSFFALVYSDVCIPAKSKGSYTICEVKTTDSGERIITHQLRQLIYSVDAGAFIPTTVAIPSAVAELTKSTLGITTSLAKSIQATAGPNLIALEAPNLYSVVFDEFSKGFYTYQIFMAWLWLNFSYWHMGIIYTVVVCVGGLSVAYVSFSNRAMLYALIYREVSQRALVLRDSNFIRLRAVEIVPGDLIAVEPGPCVADMVLVEGQAVVDESSITGESMPVHKVALDPSDGSPPIYSSRDHKKSTLLAGATILQGSDNGDTSGPTSLALVLHTGGDTEKGKQVGDILFKQPPQFKFDVQVKFVVLILMIYAVVCFSAVVLFMDEDPVYGWIYGLYVVATALPPLLPTVFVVSVGIAAKRLAVKGVLCSDPQRLLAAGKVRVCCFDKTGTLTKSGMELNGVRAATSTTTLGEHLESVPNCTLLEQGMACCHTLGKLGDTIIGAAIDRIMFSASTWVLTQTSAGIVVSAPTGGQVLKVVRRFDFDYVRQTSAVVVKDTASGEYRVFVKGSTEAIGKVLARAPSKDYVSLSEDYARAGCYTMALATRCCTAEEAKGFELGSMFERSQAEQGLELAGLMSFRNELKEDSALAMEAIKKGHCRPVMLTGDHALTGIYIAKTVGMFPEGRSVLLSKNVTKAGTIVWVDEAGASSTLTVDSELVITGDIWRVLPVDQKRSLLPFVRVLARASPMDKLDVINFFTASGLVVSMCGDGGNDVGALKAAHVGLALSDAEASIVAPFTSVNKSCMGLVDLLLEGRSSLASALACYKVAPLNYMIMYGQIETVNQVINAYFSITFAEWCWVFMDGFWVITMSFTLALAKPAEKLASIRPPSSLLGYYTMVSVVGLIVIDFIFVVIGLALLSAQDWYQCRKWDPNSANLASYAAISDNYEISVIFLISGAQYLTSAMACNFGFKHRQPWVYNVWLMFFVTIFYVCHIVILFWPSKLSCLFRINCSIENSLPGVLYPCKAPIANDWNTTVIPPNFRVTLFLLIITNTIAVVGWEYVIVLGPVGAYFRKNYPQTKPLRL